MLISREELPVNRVFQLALELPPDMQPDSKVVFGAETLWRETSGQAGQYWIGMQIIDISEEDANRIGHLVDYL